MKQRCQVSLNQYLLFYSFRPRARKCILNNVIIFGVMSSLQTYFQSNIFSLNNNLLNSLLLLKGTRLIEMPSVTAYPTSKAVYMGVESLLLLQELNIFICKGWEKCPERPKTQLDAFCSMDWSHLGLSLLLSFMLSLKVHNPKQHVNKQCMILH